MLPAAARIWRRRALAAGQIDAVTERGVLLVSTDPFDLFHTQRVAEWKALLRRAPEAGN